MNRSCLILLLGLMVLASGCATREFKEFTSEQGRFAVRLPEGQKEESEPTPDQPIGTLVLEQPNGTYQVAYQDIPAAAGESTEQLEQRLDACRDSAVENSRASRGILRSEKKITLAGRYPGRDFVIELPRQDEWIRARNYLVEGRLYQVIASGKKWWVDSHATDRVLDSFRLLPR